MQNLFVRVYEKIILFRTTLFRGDYPDLAKKGLGRQVIVVYSLLDGMKKSQICSREQATARKKVAIAIFIAVVFERPFN